MSSFKTIEIRENAHILTTFEIFDDDSYKAVAIRFMNGRKETISCRYPYRSQGNAHIVMNNEHDKVYDIISFDGHKGDVYVNENKTINNLVYELNKLEPKEEQIEDAIIYALKLLLK